jgi:hypothetical protein
VPKFNSNNPLILCYLCSANLKSAAPFGKGSEKLISYLGK